MRSLYEELARITFVPQAREMTVAAMLAMNRARRSSAPDRMASRWICVYICTVLDRDVR